MCLDAHTATAASDRLVRAEPSGMRVGGRAAVSAFARGTVSDRAATASADGTVSRPPSLLARFLTPAVYNSLTDVRTPNGFGISDITRSGRVNTDSSVGTLQCFNSDQSLDYLVSAFNGDIRYLALAPMPVFLIELLL